MSIVGRKIETNPENRWRLETPGAIGWARTARPDQPGKKKYFMVSCDTHLQPPGKLFHERIDERFRHLLPRIEVRDGMRFMVHGEDGQADRLVDSEFQGEDLVRSKAGAAFRGDSDSGFGDFTPLEQRIQDQILDGVDAEVIFPNGPALLMWAGRNVEFIAGQIMSIQAPVDMHGPAQQPRSARTAIDVGHRLERA